MDDHRRRSISMMDFEEEWGKLTSWFNVRGVKDEQIRTAYRRCKSYPVDALKSSIDEIIASRRPSAGNFPTIREIINGCCVWLDQHLDVKFERTEFDPIEDLSYPTIKLWEGFRLLQSQGQDAFKRFATSNRMPEKDIERVIAKHTCVISQDEVAKLTKRVGAEIS